MYILNVWAVVTDSDTGLSFLFAFVQNTEALVALKKKISHKAVKYLQLSVLAGLCRGSSGVSQLG